MTAHAIIERARNEGRVVLTEVESKELLGEAGINVIPARLAKTPQEAAAIGRELGFPVALKIASPDIVHKSDSGGVRMGLATPEQVVEAGDAMLKEAAREYPRAMIHGLSVQAMAAPGTEVIIGMTRDAQFGPVLMFGLGGIWVEVLKDISLRVTPLTRRDAREMIEEIKGFPVLEGERGREPVDITALEDMLLAVSTFVAGNPAVRELDLNPVIASGNGAVAADARIVLEEK
ncbi:MAG: acetate--CoA ligase family protein [Chloroflexota bacterium]